MNTPAHVIANLLILGRRQDRGEIGAVVAGSLLPDLPIIWFYFWEKVVRGTEEMTIWRESYYREGWQLVFDLFNSLPILAVLFVAAWFLGARRWGLLFAGMALHALFDLPLHNDDGHRHLFPLSDWRFESPVSYWDPDHWGLWVSLLEIGLVVAGSIWLWRYYRERWAKALVGLIAAGHAAYIAYVLIVWV